MGPLFAIDVDPAGALGSTCDGALGSTCDGCGRTVWRAATLDRVNYCGRCWAQDDRDQAADDEQRSEAHQPTMSKQEREP